MDKLQAYTKKEKAGEFFLEEYKVVSKEDAHEKDLLHKSAHLVVLCDNKILSRKRGNEEVRYSGLYTTTLGAHVLLGETYETTIKKHVPSHDAELKWVGEFFVHDEWENEINELYIMELGSDLLLGDFMIGREFLTEEDTIDFIEKGKATPHLAKAFGVLLKEKLII